MQIIVTYDSSADSAPAAFKTDVQVAVNFLEAAFTNNVTLNINVGWGEVDGSALRSGDLGESFFAEAPNYTYSQIVNALSAQAMLPNASPDLVAAVQTLAGLPDPTNGGNFDIGRPEAKALGLLPADNSHVDGWVGFSTSADWSYSPTATPGANQYYLIGTIEHEITEVMGRVANEGTVGEHNVADAWGLPDLFRFSAPGVRQLTTGPLHSTGYFSIDNGNTVLGTWNNFPSTGDLADWNKNGNEFGGGGPGPSGSDSFDDFSNPGVLNQVTNTDLTLMHVLGWEASQPLNFVMNGEMYYVGAGQQSQNNLVIESGGTVEVADGGTLNGTVTFDGTGGLLTIDGSSPPGNVISGFVAGDTIDFFGAAIGAHPTVTLLQGNVLEIVEHSHTYDFQLDPNDNFTGQTFSAVGDGSGGTLIYINPGVQSVTASGPGITNGSGDLNAGHTVTLTLNTNEAIDIDTTNGTPTLSLNDGGTATYSGGSGSNALNFQYTVAAGENTTDLAVTGFQLNGAAAEDANGHAAVFAGAIGNLPGTLQIDTTAPVVTGITASPSDGIENVGSEITFTLSFDEDVTVTGGTPALTLNNGANAVYDAGATAALHDATKLVFDYLVSGNEPPTPALAVTGLNAQGAAIADLAGNPANLTTATAAFAALSVNDAPAYQINGFVRPELHFNSAGDIILDAPAAAAAATYGLKFLYVGLPETTPYPPVADTPHDQGFHLLT
jgi:hypothetical protein